MHIAPWSSVIGTALLARLASAKDVTLFGPTNQPEESDVNQVTSDCFLEATLAAVIHTDLEQLTGMLNNTAPNCATVMLYGDKDIEPKKIYINLIDALDEGASKSPWIAAIQEAFRQITGHDFKTDTVFSKTGGTITSALRAIYGPTYAKVTSGCDGRRNVTEKATWKPTVLATNKVAGALANGHGYTVRGGNDTHVTLRNPWGFSGIDTKKYPDVEDLGEGNFNIPVSMVDKQCADYEYADILNAAEHASVESALTQSSASAVASAEALAATMSGPFSLETMTGESVFTFISKRSVSVPTPTPSLMNPRELEPSYRAASVTTSHFVG